MNSIFNKFVLIAFLFFGSNLWATDSGKILTELMENPYLNEAYRRTQIAKSSTKLDTLLINFFETDPIISQARPSIERALTESMRVSMAASQGNMTAVTEKSEPEFYFAVRKVMLRHGFSEKQIANTQIFKTMGPPNAWTSGVDKDHVVVTATDSLLKMTSSIELEAILGHEFKHVLNQHVVQGLMLNLMIERVASLAFSQNPYIDFDGEEAVSKKIFDQMEEDYTVDRIRRFGQSHAEAVQGAKLALMPVRIAFNKINIKIENLSKQFGPGVLIESSQRFLSLLLEGLSDLEVPRETLFFLANLNNLLPTPYRPNMNDFLNHWKIISGAASREQETSADLGGVTVSEPYFGAKFDIQTAGGGGLKDKDQVEQDKVHSLIRDLQIQINILNKELGKPVQSVSSDEYSSRPTSREELRSAIAHIRTELDDMKSKQTEEEYYLQISASGRSHPLGNIRALNQIYYSRSKDLIAMRNKFLRLVALQETVEEEYEKSQEILKQLNKQKKNLKKIPPHLEKIISLLEDKISEIDSARPVLDLLLEQQITELGFEGVNPRLRNLVEYHLAEKDYYFQLFETSQMERALALKQAGTKEEKSKVHNYFDLVDKKIDVELSKKNAFLEKIKNLIKKSKGSQEYVQMIDILNSKQLNREVLLSMVQYLRVTSSSENRDSRTDLSLSLKPKDSTAKSFVKYANSKEAEAVTPEINLESKLKLTCAMALSKVRSAGE